MTISSTSQLATPSLGEEMGELMRGLLLVGVIGVLMSRVQEFSWVH